MKYTAKSADKFVLYQEAVQSPQAEVYFFDKLYRERYGKPATLFREDFCGTAMISCEWAKWRRVNHAYGVDLCRETLAWGREHNINQLPPHAAKRVHLVHQNVLHVIKPRVHIIGAFNYSYYIFREKDQLVQYFECVRRSLLPQGMFICDAYGGWESQEPMKERTRCKGFTYVWDQAEYNPVKDETTCHIHFEFRDGTRMRKAFTYHWRLWTLGGIQDALRDAGFSEMKVYWEGTEAKTGRGNGAFRTVKKAENCSAWNAYVVAMP